MVANRMQYLIERKKYDTLQAVIDRLNSFVTWIQITPEEYNKLMTLAEETYNPQPVVIPEVTPDIPEGEPVI